LGILRSIIPLQKGGTDKVSENKRLIADLISIVEKGNLSAEIYERIAYGQDGIQPDLEPDKIPAVVVKPTSAQEVSKVVRYANDKRIPIYIHGAGTAFKGSARPKRPGSILLSTGGLTTIELHEEDMYFEAGAGANQYELEKLLLGRGYILPMNVGSKYSSTIGGAVSINTIGHMVDICLGKLIDHIMGLEVVLPNGEIIETGTRSIRRPAGIDYTRFFAGMEGVFGVITKVRMRLLPSLKKAYVVGFFPDLTDIAHAFMRFYREKLPPPLYGELLDKKACVAPFRLRGLGEPKGHMGLATAVGHTQEDADRQAEDIVRVFKAENAVEARAVKSLKEQEDYWASRDNILNILQTPEGEEKLLPSGALEASVPLSHLADAIDYFRTGHGYRTLHEATLFIYGHVGTCDLHGLWCTPASWPLEKRLQCRKEGLLLEKEVSLMWGCASGEIGQTAMRIGFLRERYGEAAYSMLMAIKKTIDPNNILNPGNLEGEGYEI
jgi:glycolate oxidase